MKRGRRKSAPAPERALTRDSIVLPDV